MSLSMVTFGWAKLGSLPEGLGGVMSRSEFY